MKFRPLKIISISDKGVPVISGTNVSIADLFRTLSWQRIAIEDVANEFDIDPGLIIELFQELAINIIPAEPMKIELTIDGPDGPISVSDTLYSPSSSGDVTNIAKKLWKALKNCENTSPYSFWVKDYGPKKIQMIKLVREITGMGLRESKDLVESAPFLIPIDRFTDNKQEKIDSIARKLNALGAEYSLLGKNETEVLNIMHK